MTLQNNHFVILRKRIANMKKIVFLILFSFFTTATIFSQKVLIDHIIDSIGKIYVPDKRIAVYHLSTQTKDNEVILKGNISDKIAYRKLIQALKNKNLTFSDSIALLPEMTMGKKHWSIVPLSAIYIRKNPDFASELITQALMGTPVKVLDRHRGWKLIQTPDQYIGWTNVNLPLFTKKELHKTNQYEKLIVTKTHAIVYEKPSLHSSLLMEVILGDIMELSDPKTINNFYSVSLPDGSKGFIQRSSAITLGKWHDSFHLTGENIVNTARLFMGLPYLWGGASIRGCDCSGFVKMVYFMYGIILPRDASQQFFSGETINMGKEYENLQKGDLLFFGKKFALHPEQSHIEHVAIYMGDRLFIHSLEKVHISSLNPDSPFFDAYNTTRLVGAKRIIGSQKINYWTYFEHAWNR